MYASLSYYGSFIKETKENYSDDIVPLQWFPPLYSYTCPSYSIHTHRYTLLEPIKSFHQRVEHTHYGDQELVLVSIPPGNKEYRFYSDCCKLDAVSYLNQDTVHDGVAINGVFYQFNADFAPLGGYKQGDIEVLRELQAAYSPFYRAITLSHDGLLNIDTRPIDDVWATRHTFNSVMFCAPMLVDQGEIAITDDMISQTTHDGVHILQCEISKSNESGMNIVRGDKTIKSCSSNLPGGLFHAANANPRSALIIDKKGTRAFA
jgi:hypothetical protein